MTRRPAPRMAYDATGSSKQWAKALARMDRSGRLTQRKTNQILDTLALQIDVEREAAGRALRARLVREKGGR
jgi:hypothetical protein